MIKDRDIQTVFIFRNNCGVTFSTTYCKGSTKILCDIKNDEVVITYYDGDKKMETFSIKKPDIVYITMYNGEECYLKGGRS